MTIAKDLLLHLQCWVRLVWHINKGEREPSDTFEIKSQTGAWFKCWQHRSSFILSIDQWQGLHDCEIASFRIHVLMLNPVQFSRLSISWLNTLKWTTMAYLLELHYLQLSIRSIQRFFRIYSYTINIFIASTPCRILKVSILYTLHYQAWCKQHIHTVCKWLGTADWSIILQIMKKAFNLIIIFLTKQLLWQ